MPVNDEFGFRELRRATNGYRLILSALLAVQVAILAWTDWRTAPTWDEWGHLPSGIYHLKFGEFEPYCVNPPLTRMIAATPVIAKSGGIRWVGLPHTPGWRSEWLLRSLFIQTFGAECFALFSIARLALIPISLFGTYLLWSIGTRLYGHASGVVAAALWCFSPMALGFGATIAPDVSATVFGLFAAYRFYIWLRLGSWTSVVWLAVATALAMLSKSTWLILPIVFVGIYAGDRMLHRRHDWPKDFLQWSVGFLLAWVLIHACYDFRGMLRPLGAFEFRSQALTGHDRPNRGTGNRFSGTLLGLIPAPLPEDYVYGLDIQRCDFEGKFQSYLLGEWRGRGWWYYYLIGLPLKEPVALWGLLALTAVGAAFRFQPRIHWREVVLLAPSTAVLIFVSSQTGFSHHLRYALPFLPCLYLLAARSAAARGSWSKRLAYIFCGWYAISSVSILPRSYAFFSEAVGGADEGWRYLGDSNLDWGQDLLTLRDWANANPDKRPIWLLYSPDMLDFNRLGIDATNGQSRIMDGRPAVAGWWAIFATPMIEPQNHWFLHRKPTIRLSPTLKIIEVTQRELDNLALDSDPKE